MTSRRGFLKGLLGGAAIVAAPALIREGFAMPVKPELGSLTGDLVIDSSEGWSKWLKLRAVEQHVVFEQEIGWGQDRHTEKRGDTYVVNGVPDKQYGLPGPMGACAPRGDWTVQLEAWRDSINRHYVDAGLLGVAHIPSDPGPMYPIHPSYTAGHGIVEARDLKELRKRYPR